MKKLIATILLFSMLSASTALGVIGKYSDQCDTRWVEGENYVCYSLYSLEGFMELEPGNELPLMDQKLCQEENGGFTAVIRNGVKGFISVSGQFIPLEVR